MATITARNGVNVEQLIATIGAIQQDPNVGAFTFKASSSWRSGAHNDGEIKDFVHAGQPAVRPEAFRLAGDEPPVLLGSNEGPNAVELLLQALGFCYAVGYVYNAAARGIDITELRYEIEGDLDLRTFVGLDGPRAGFTAIRATGWVKSPNASAEQLDELCQYVQDTSPVRDCLANPIPVKTDLVILD
jgi:uncharacterized OsmC-like protein